MCIFVHMVYAVCVCAIYIDIIYLHAITNILYEYIYNNIYILFVYYIFFV